MNTRRSAFTRRDFLAQASCFGALYGLAQTIPLAALGAELEGDSRVGATVVADKGFAAVRKVGEGLFATISDTSKGFTTVCNGGFLAGKESALLLEGFGSPAGAAFQMQTLRSLTRVPVQAALDTHYHFDHSLGNAFYGANGIPVWAHATAAKRIAESYMPLQGVEKSQALAPYEGQIAAAKSELAKTHAQGDLAAVTGVYTMVNATVLGLPNHPIDPASLPMKLDLGGLTAVIESHPGHSGTDLIVRVHEQNVVYTGDLLFNGWYPVCFDDKATVSGWRDTLKKFAAFDKETIFVPGHGQICGQEGIASIREVFDDLVEQAQKMHAAGIPADEAQHRYVVPDKFKDFRIYAWGLTVGPAITKLYAEWGAK